MTDAAQTPSLPRGWFNLLAAIARLARHLGDADGNPQDGRRGCQCGPDRSCCPLGRIVGPPSLLAPLYRGDLAGSGRSICPLRPMTLLGFPEVTSWPLIPYCPNGRRLVPYKCLRAGGGPKLPLFRPEETPPRDGGHPTTKPSTRSLPITAPAGSFVLLHVGMPVHRTAPFAGASQRTDTTSKNIMKQRLTIRIDQPDADNIFAIANALRSGRRPFPTRTEAAKLALAVVAADAARFVPGRDALPASAGTRA